MPRPRKADRRHHQVNVRLSAPEYVRVHAHAALTGKTVTDFARAVLLRRPRRRKSAPEPEIIALADVELPQWHDLGTRLNHVAHLMNGRDGLPPSELAALLGQIGELMDCSLAGAASAEANSTPYALAPPVRHHLRKVGVNLAQISRRFDQLGLDKPVALVRLLAGIRMLLAGDRPPHAA
jgi:hypothetical protein